jgi:predicted permease
LWSTNALLGALTSALPITLVLEGALSPALVVATLTFCLLATGWFALGPALRHSRADVLSDLKPQAGEDLVERRRRFLPRNPLVVGQVALSLSLLIAAGLFVRMAQTALVIDFGFQADDTVVAEVDSRLAGYSVPQSLDLYADIERRLSALPGVQAASVAAIVPLGFVNVSQSVRRAGINVADGSNPQTPEEGHAFGAPWNAVSGGYFVAMGVPVLQGRTFTDVESFGAGARKVAVVDEALARKLWPDGGALGQRIEFARGNRPASDPVPTMEIVGVVGSTRRELFDDELPGAVYVPFAQGAMGNAHFHVRPVVAQPALADAVRREIRAAAPSLPIFSARTFGSHIGNSIEYWTLRLSAGLFGAFGAFAMLVALVGIYGVMSYAVARRTREIGIRMAVGATAGSVKRMIVHEGLTLTLLGVGVGWALGLGTGRLLASVFVDLAPFDPLTFTLVPVGFVIAALVAAWIPARRATLVNPIAALRAE